MLRVSITTHVIATLNLVTDIVLTTAINYSNLKPGGWIEVQELAMPISDDDTLAGTDQNISWDLMLESTAKAGRPYASTRSFKGFMEEGGFTNVVEKHFVWPHSPWPRDAHLKELGRWHNLNLKEGIEAFLLAGLTRVLGWSREEVTVLAAKTRASLDDRRIHAYTPT